MEEYWKIIMYITYWVLDWLLMFDIRNILNEACFMSIFLTSVQCFVLYFIYSNFQKQKIPFSFHCYIFKIVSSLLRFLDTPIFFWNMSSFKRKRYLLSSKESLSRYYEVINGRAWSNLLNLYLIWMLPTLVIW